MLSDIQLSDLFFNYDHPEWSDACASGVDFAPREAILVDAQDFADAYPQLGKSAEWYADDFLRRV